MTLGVQGIPCTKSMNIQRIVKYRAHRACPLGFFKFIGYYFIISILIAIIAYFVPQPLDDFLRQFTGFVLLYYTVMCYLNSLENYPPSGIITPNITLIMGIFQTMLSNTALKLKENTLPISLLIMGL